MMRASRHDPDALPEADRFLEAPLPREAARLIGHADALVAFLDAHEAGRLHHAWLIGGEPGIGKATLAYLIAKVLMSGASEAAHRGIAPDTAAAKQIAAGAHPDLATVRRSLTADRKALSGEIRVDDVRQATHLFETTAAAGGWRIAVVDSIDEMNTNAANALLKMLEEPPPRSLFLLVSHAPGRLLPTIRSRCRMLHLKPLSAREVEVVTAGLPAWADLPPDQHHQAAEQSGGSVREALKLLDEDTAAFRKHVAALLERLPAVDHRAVRDLGAAVDGRAGAERMELLRLTIEDFLTRRLRAAAAGSPARLAPLGEVWDKLTDSVREAEIFNLDRRPLVIALFASLAEAVRAEQASL